MNVFCENLKIIYFCKYKFSWLFSISLHQNVTHLHCKCQKKTLISSNTHRKCIVKTYISNLVQKTIRKSIYFSIMPLHVFIETRSGELCLLFKTSFF